MRDGNFVSAGSPDVWQTERIGTVFNARRDGDSLRCEAWIDPDLVERAGKEAAAILKAAEDGDQVEVSTAAWVDEVPTLGVHAGRQYDQIQTNFQPDHIALLGDVKGACSWEDGCGVRVASAANEIDACCDDCASGKPCSCEDTRSRATSSSCSRTLRTTSEEDGEVTDPKTTRGGGEPAVQDRPAAGPAAG